MIRKKVVKNYTISANLLDGDGPKRYTDSEDACTVAFLSGMGPVQKRRSFYGERLVKNITI